MNVTWNLCRPPGCRLTARRRFPGQHTAAGLENIEVHKKWLENFWNFGKNPDFLKNFRFLEKFQIFGNISEFWKSFGFLEKFPIFGIVLNLQIFLDFWENCTFHFSHSF